MPDSDRGISLYECANAHVQGQRIRCTKNHILNGATYNRLAKGCPMIFEGCQKCKDVEQNGEPVQPEDRGWEGIS